MKGANKVKKRVSFSVRLMSVILTFLLLFTMTAGLGVTNVSAAEYSKSDVVYAHVISPGDILNPGAKVRNNHFESHVIFLKIYIDDKEIPNGGEYTFNERVTLMSKVKVSVAMTLKFKTLDSEKSVEYNDDVLKEQLQQNEEVTLTEDIYLKDTVKINDGKSHVINTNGYNVFINSTNIGIFTVENRSTLTINGLGDRDVKSTFYGTGGNNTDSSVFKVNSNSRLVLNDVIIDGNASKDGGGVCAIGGSVELTGCEIRNCKVNEKGGGLYIDANSTADITNCKIENNNAHDGGGICSFGRLNVTNCLIYFNWIKGGGSGIWSKGNAFITGTKVEQNLNAVHGGGITNHKDMTIKDCTITNNRASGWGGGFFNDAEGSAVFEGKNVISNNISNDGAGIFHRKGKLSVSNTSFLNNSAKAAGGGIWANNDTELSLDNVKMQGNSCVTNGGAINSHGTVSLKNCSIDSNSADNCGGGVYMDSSSTLTVNSSSIIYCQAKGSGGGIYFHSGELILAGGKTMITNCQTNGNTDNINQREFKNIKVTGRLSSGSQIGFKPPANGANRYVTTGYGQKNNAATATYFQCDTNDFKINRNKNDEVYLVEGLKGTFSSYKISINIKVTDDADAWDYAYFQIFARDDKGNGLANPIHTTGDFHTAIDDDGEEYTYEYDCGNNYFPSSVDVVTSFGNWGIWRDFEADVTIKINGINVCSNHIVHKVYGDERKNTELKITGDKYPYPESFDVEVPPGDIENSGTVTVSAVDQYGLTWNSDGGETTMKNISFPEEDTFEKLDNNGSKWKLSSTHKTNHWSTYNLIFKSGSNVYPEIVKPITVKFVFPLHVRVIVDGEEVFETTGMEKETIEIKNIESIPGYYINGYEKTGTGELVKVNDNEYKLTLINESVTLTAKLKANNYRIVYDANGTKGEDGGYTDIIGLMSKKTAYYGKEFTLNPVRFMREGYTFAGWNTKPDGSGQMFKDMGTVLNLTTVRAEEVNLYAIWKPNDGPTTASIFSDGTALIYVGAGILILSIVASIIYSKRKKRDGVKAVKQ